MGPADSGGASRRLVRHRLLRRSEIDDPPDETDRTPVPVSMSTSLPPVFTTTGLYGPTKTPGAMKAFVSAAFTSSLLALATKPSGTFMRLAPSVTTVISMLPTL